MINKIIAFSIKQKLVIGLLVLILILFGIYSAIKLPIDAVPDITNNQIRRVNFINIADTDSSARVYGILNKRTTLLKIFFK